MTMRPYGIYTTPPSLKVDPNCPHPKDIACRLSTNICSGLCSIHSPSDDGVPTIAPRTTRFLPKPRVLIKQRFSALKAASRGVLDRQPYLIDEERDDYVMVDSVATQALTPPLEIFEEVATSHGLDIVYESELESEADESTADEAHNSSIYIEHLEPSSSAWVIELPNLRSDNLVYTDSAYGDAPTQYAEESSIYSEELAMPTKEPVELSLIAQHPDTDITCLTTLEDPLCPAWLLPLIDFSPISTRSRLPPLVPSSSTSSCESDDDGPSFSPSNIIPEHLPKPFIVQRKRDGRRGLKRPDAVRDFTRRSVVEGLSDCYDYGGEGGEGSEGDGSVGWAY
ncbi:hypothetical protein IAR50_005127 [Cryptococcus sp. DSM 104548]